MSALRSLIPSFDVKLSAIILAGFIVLSASGSAMYSAGETRVLKYFQERTL
jgi:hypothetical protein